MKTNIKILSCKSEHISADLFHYSRNITPLVIFSHGFKGFKDWGGFPYMMEKLAVNGFAALSFNFSYNGVSESSPEEFTRLDLFAKNTFSKELEDLANVIDYCYLNHKSLSIDINRIALMGHSRGGGISIIKASEDKRIKCLVTLAAVSSFDRYSDNIKKIWREQGYIEIENQRTKQMMKLNVSLLDDIENNKSKLDIIAKARMLNKPFLIIHGSEDLAVNAEEAKQIYEVSDKSKTELAIVENTGHTFGVVHPFKGTTDAFEKVISRAVNFFKENL